MIQDSFHTRSYQIDIFQLTNDFNFVYLTQKEN